MARRFPPAQTDLNILTTIGWIITAACLESDVMFIIGWEPYLAESYYQAVRIVCRCSQRRCCASKKANDIVGLLFTAAALQGHIKLAEVLANLDSCPHCSEGF